MPTERLHLRDSLLLTFEARLAGLGHYDGKPSVVLDRTAFYPEAGGQLGDRGRLVIGGIEHAIIDVQGDDAGDVHHLLSAPIEESLVGADVRGTVDERHRRDQMSQHTGQHMLSRAFHDVARLGTVSARLGSTVSTIDLDTPALSLDAIREAEDRVNSAVLEDRPIRVLFPTDDELRAMPLRKTPTVRENIRIIEVDAFDLTPCGGTHCQRTGQVGPVVVIGQERYKKLMRITFLAGERTLRHLREGEEILHGLAETFACSRSELIASASRTRNDLRQQQQALGQVRAELMRYLAATILDEHPVDPVGTTPILAVRETDDLNALRALASALTARPDVAAAVVSKDVASGDWQVVVRRGASAHFDAGRWLKTFVSTQGGRGGGRPEHAEGRVPFGVDWSAVTLAQ